MLLHIGHKNFVNSDRIVSVVCGGSSPARKIIAAAREAGMLVDATQGRKTRSVIVTESGHVVLASVKTETIAKHYQQ